MKTTHLSHPRRLALSAAGLLALAAVAFFTTTGSARSATLGTTAPKPTIVLVHGAWADGSSWAQVVRRLQQQGYTVDVPNNPLRTLHGDSAFIASYLRTIKGPMVLVGHSYGGAVITNAATGNTNVKALVYINAFVPDEGETIGQLVAAQPGSRLAVADPSTVFNFAQDPGLPAADVDAYVKPELFRAFFAADIPAKRAAVLASLQRPIAVGTLQEPSGPPAWKTIPSWDLIGTADQVIPPAEQRFMAARANATTVQIDSSHLSLVSHPDAVTKLITDAAHSVR